MSENTEAGRPIYPVTLDVVEFNGNEYQVIASSQTGKVANDRFVLKDIRTEEILRVKGAVFAPIKLRDPGPGDVYRKDEGVKVTGLIFGGEIEES